jgi:hypothetical protein
VTQHGHSLPTAASRDRCQKSAAGQGEAEAGRHWGGGRPAGGQATEVAIAVGILNRMLKLGRQIPSAKCKKRQFKGGLLRCRYSCNKVARGLTRTARPTDHGGSDASSTPSSVPPGRSGRSLPGTSSGPNGSTPSSVGRSAVLQPPPRYQRRLAGAAPAGEGDDAWCVHMNSVLTCRLGPPHPRLRRGYGDSATAWERQQPAGHWIAGSHRQDKCPASQPPTLCKAQSRR